MPFLLLMPSYNQSRYIAEAIRSVLAQDDGDWELWIVDNSSDDTPSIVAQFTDSRIHFHHIKERMDPGSCLNWMLERAKGRDFSYVHTDNNLHPAYVRRMRAALAENPLALAYCDMRTIDDDGDYINVNRRGVFDFARLLSVDSLGVPFAATTELAQQVGGFSARDFADDVRFCVEAYGLAKYIYLPEPLLDYRLHGNSRTEEAGGAYQMHRLFAKLMPKLLPSLEKRNLDPVTAMQIAIRQAFNEMDYFVEDLWHRKLARRVAPWWQGHPRIDNFVFSRAMIVPGFFGAVDLSDSKASAPGRATYLSSIYLRIFFWARRRDLRRLTTRARNLVLTWATMVLRVQADGPVAIRVSSLDFRTLWVARQLEMVLGWKILWDGKPLAPKWLPWSKASGVEPLLDCSSSINLG